MKSASEAMDKRDRNEPDAVAPAAKPGDRVAHTAEEKPRDGDETFHVFGSGNLGLIYVRGEKERLDRGRSTIAFPDSSTGWPSIPASVSLSCWTMTARSRWATTAGTDSTTATSKATTPWSRSARTRPSSSSGSRTAPKLPTSTSTACVDPGTEEVAAFEGLVGCHGGLGGWQDRACVVVPSDLPFPDERVVGADAMHVALRTILRHCGHRKDITEPGAQPPPMKSAG